MTHSNKGFTVYVMKSSELRKLEQREQFMHVPALQGLKVHSFSKTQRSKPARGVVVVLNSENLLFTMVARLQVVSDPGA